MDEGKLSCIRMKPEVYQVTGTFFLIMVKCVLFFKQSLLEWKKAGKSTAKYWKKGQVDHNLVDAI